MVAYVTMELQINRIQKKGLNIYLNENGVKTKFN
ncbi:hypothetical protein EC970010_1371, partial [Escherichia coli 97.0010]